MSVTAIASTDELAFLQIVTFPLMRAAVRG